MVETICSNCGKTYETYVVILDSNELSIASELTLRDEYYDDTHGLCEGCREIVIGEQYA